MNAGGLLDLERLLEHLSVRVEALAVCTVARGWRLRLPALDRAALHFVLEGSGGLRPSAGANHPVRANTLVVVPAGRVHLIEHGVRAPAEARVRDPPPRGAGLPTLRAGPPDLPQLLVACGRLEAEYGGAVGLFDHLQRLLVVDFDEDPRLRQVFEALLDERRTPRPGSRRLTSALMSECLVHVLRRIVHGGEGCPCWLEALGDGRLSPVLDFVVDHPGRPHSVESLAEIACLSRSSFAERFRRTMGRTPMEFVREVRLQRAARILRRRPRPPVARVARRVGYSRSHFSRLFRDRFGAAPRDFPAESGVRRRGGERAGPVRRAGR